MHGELMAEHGGLSGPADFKKLSATLARPLHLETYSDPAPTLYQLAASYGFGFAKNHCFKDGNKRVALVAIDVFLALNGFELIASEEDAVLTILALAASDINEAELADWIEKNVQPLP